MKSWPILILKAAIMVFSLALVPPAFPAVVPLLSVPEWNGELNVDAKLEESCYRTNSPIEQFVVAGQPGKQAPRTRAWLFWNAEKLIFAFDCEDTNIIAALRSTRERDVDGQDRIELFLWSGRSEESYACLEIGARGALHDYQARFYRKFDSSWTAPGLKYATSLTPSGYRVEGEISRRGMEELGFRLEPGARIRAGLFRADFSSSKKDAEPLWITWIDAKGPKPDFHVAESFGEIVFQSVSQRTRTEK
jgi:hypothetical protein